MIAGEGWPWLIVFASLGLLLAWFQGPVWASPFAVLTVLLFLLFRDPGREVPPLPLAVVAPIDGRVTEVVRETGGILDGDWIRISIRTNHFGAYTVRSPIEGSVRDVRAELQRSGPDASTGLWVRSEEQDDVVMLFADDGRGFAPKAFVRYGERVGQGQRFAYLRLAPGVSVWLPATASVTVAPGDRIRAGCDVLAELAER